MEGVLGFAALIDIIWMIAVLLMPFVLFSIRGRLIKLTESLEDLKLVQLGFGEDLGLSRNQLIEKYGITSKNGLFIHGKRRFRELDEALLKARLEQKEG